MLFAFGLAFKAHWESTKRKPLLKTSLFAFSFSVIAKLIYVHCKNFYKPISTSPNCLLLKGQCRRPCFSSLLLCKELPETQQLKTTSICYLTVSMGQQSGRGFAGSFAQRVAGVRVSSEAQDPLSCSRGRIQLLQL